MNPDRDMDPSTFLWGVVLGIIVCVMIILIGMV